MPGLKGAAGECLGCRKESGCRDSTFPAQSSRIGDVILKVHVLDIMRPESRSLDPIDNGKLRLDPREGVTMPSSGSSSEPRSPDPVNGGNVGRIGRGKAATSAIRRQGSMTLPTAEPLPSSGPLVNGPELRSSDPIYGGNGGRLRRGKSLALEKETFRAACVQKLPSNGFSRKATPNQKNSAWAEIVGRPVRHGLVAKSADPFSDPVCPLYVDRLECYGQIRGRGEQSGGFNASVRWKIGFGDQILSFVLSIYAGSYVRFGYRR